MLMKTQTEEKIDVPFYRPDIGDQEIEEVISSLRSGWLTSGPKVHRFEEEFARAVGATYAVAVNSCTAALHLAVEALGLTRDQGVLVPTMTFAATAEIVRYQGAIPILVDCDPITGNMDLADADRKLTMARNAQLLNIGQKNIQVVGIIPVHVGGMMMDIEAVQSFASRNHLWVIEDAAHAFPSAWRRQTDEPWQWCGQNTATVSCFSFYANKTITTGEGGMAVTEDKELADRMRLMSLHGLSHDAWGRYSGNGSWDYQIVAPGYKYNLTDIAAAIGLHQLARAEEMRSRRQDIALQYLESLSTVAEIELPLQDADRLHSWHLFPIRLRLERLRVDRNILMEEFRKAGVKGSVHWRPLPLHPYYQATFGWQEAELPKATTLWERLISLPIFPGMRPDEVRHVMNTIKGVCAQYGR
jgi:dTDP-4-amino-4,6-dideoxygalactose transaminase